MLFFIQKDQSNEIKFKILPTNKNYCKPFGNRVNVRLRHQSTKSNKHGLCKYIPNASHNEKDAAYIHLRMLYTVIYTGQLKNGSGINR